MHKGDNVLQNVKNRIKEYKKDEDIKAIKEIKNS